MNGYTVDDPKITSMISSFDLHLRTSMMWPSMDKNRLKAFKKIDGVDVLARLFDASATSEQAPTNPSGNMPLSNSDTITRNGLGYPAVLSNSTISEIALE
jgi:hypothetical protein